MRITHLCLGNSYIDHYAYQENLITKYHKLLGHDVTIIASLASFDKDGNPSFLSAGSQYVNECGIPVTRLDYRGNLRIARKLRRYVGIPEALEQAAPDILFIHGCQFTDIGLVVDYLKRHQSVRTYVDNHADFSNSARNFFSRNILHKVIWRSCAQKIAPYARKFYGVLPARVDFLKNVYHVPANKVELLVMGADDEAVRQSADPAVRARIRAQYGIAEDDFLVMTGGKINAFKTQTLLLMQAVRESGRPHLKLIVFGSVIAELKAQVAALSDGVAVQFIGWVDAARTYDYFAACDLAVFPGRHSVFWEQVCGQGIPLLVKRWDGTTHVDVGGNARFLTKDSMEEIRTQLCDLVDHPAQYAQMRFVARQDGMKRFSYRDIALRSISEEETGHADA